jgi:hypothetical protein
MPIGTILPVAVKPVGPNAAGCRLLYLIDKRYINNTRPERNPTTGIVTGSFVIDDTVLYPDPVVLQLMAPIGNTLGYTEEPLPDKGSKAKLYTITWALSKNNPKHAQLENKYFIPGRYMALLLDQNGFAIILGYDGPGGRIDRSTASGYDLGTDRNELVYAYTVEEREAVPFYTTDSGEENDPFDIVYP